MIPLKGLNTVEKNNELMQIISNQVPFDWAKELLQNMLALSPAKRYRFSKLKRYFPSNTASVQ